jgi:hypothetical protein
LSRLVVVLVAEVDGEQEGNEDRRRSKSGRGHGIPGQGERWYDTMRSRGEDGTLADYSSIDYIVTSGGTYAPTDVPATVTVETFRA